jgi:Family of unknown function (DUF6191)
MLFAPGKRYEREERLRVDVTREDAGDAAPPCTVVDLDHGVAFIRVPDRTTEPDQTLPPR